MINPTKILRAHKNITRCFKKMDLTLEKQKRINKKILKTF